MRTLTVHIGMPKTATTTLQNIWFPRLASQGHILYDGKREATTVERRSALATAFQQMESEGVDRSIDVIRQAIDDWVAMNGHADHVVVSDEGFASWRLPREEGLPRRLRSRGTGWPVLDGALSVSDSRSSPPLLRFISVLKDRVGPEVPLRLIMTIRNQPEFLASLYAQTAGWMSAPSQADFERKVDLMIAADDPFVDWSLWIRELHDVLDPSQLLVVPIEVGLRELTTRIGTFIGVDAAPIDPGATLNRRRTAEGEWRMRDALIGHRLVSLTSSLVPVERLPLPVRRSLRPLRRMATSIDRLNERRGRDSRSDRRIRLTEELRSRILTWQSTNNHSLEVSIGESLPAAYFATSATAP